MYRLKIYVCISDSYAARHARLVLRSAGLLHFTGKYPKSEYPMRGFFYIRISCTYPLNELYEREGLQG